MSLTGALIAVFIQQWAQSYLQATQERHSPKFRARIRTFHAEALDKLYFHRITRAVPILIHLSLFLFFAGLPIFLFNINRTVFNVVVAWLALCVAGYACITLMPIIRQDSPYYSPLSSSIWWCVANTPFLFFRILRNFMPHNHVVQWYHAHYAKSHFRWPSLHAMRRAAERFARKLSSDIDYRALLWMFKTLNDDDEFEQFFDALPGLCDSEELVDAQKAFIKPNEKALSRALIGMMDRTLLSELVPESVKQRRIIICTKVIGATFLLEPWWTLPRVLFGDWIGFSRSIHFGLLVQGWKKKIDPVIAFYGQFVVAVTLASVQQRDERWFELASGQLNESKSYLRSYYANGDSILLANAIFIIRRTVQTFSGLENRHQGDIRALEASSKTLELVCRFDIQNTQEEHQHVFCSLWNQLVDEAQINPDPHITSICVMMLRRIRRLYVTLHRNLPTQHGNFPTRHGNPTTLHGNTHLSTHETPRTRLAASTPFNSVPADPAVAEVPNEAMSYPRCNVYEHRPFTPVPRLPLNGLRINTNTRHVSMDKIRELTSYLVPVLPPTHSTPYGPPVLPGQYPLVSDPYSDSASHAPPVPRVTFGRARPHGRSGHSRDVSGTTAEAASRSNSRSPSPASPVYPDSELSFPARQRVPTITILNPSSDDPTTPFIQPPVMPGTPTAPPLPPPASAAGSTTTSSVRRVIPSTPYERMPSPRPSLSVEAPSLNSVHSGIPVQVPTTASPRTPTQTVPMSTAPSITSRSRSFFSSLTGRGSTSVPSSAVRRGGPAQTPSAVPPVIRFSGYGEFSGLSYYSPHSVRYETNLYPTALHLFEARKFLPHRPDLADRVRQCERVEQVPSISAELADFIRRDWDNVMLSIVSKVFPCLAPRVGGGCSLTDRRIAGGRVDG